MGGLVAAPTPTELSLSPYVSGIDSVAGAGAAAPSSGHSGWRSAQEGPTPRSVAPTDRPGSTSPPGDRAAETSLPA
jgi:hypothetical protein